MGLESYSIFTDADSHSLHVKAADHAIFLGNNPNSYLDAKKIISLCIDNGINAVHPGYGFLSENPEFAEALRKEGIAFIGPNTEEMRLFSFKHTARKVAQNAKVPIVPGSQLVSNISDAIDEACKIGYPIILKSTAGGGGIGMHVCKNSEELSSNFEIARKHGKNFFGNGEVYLERYISSARHIEVQIFGDGKGNVIHLGERECSMQRRHQKTIEETPAPRLSEKIRNELVNAAVRLGRSVNYKSAGTVEFILDDEKQEFYFLEVNTRLQVEHRVTEMVSGFDIVEMMISLELNPESFDLDYYATNFNPTGSSIECRIYSEDPSKNFLPTTGVLSLVEFPVRKYDWLIVDSWISQGIEISTFYDPMIGKIVVKGIDREDAIKKMKIALTETRIEGIMTNQDFLLNVLQSEKFVSGELCTTYLEKFDYVPNTVQVVSPGMNTTVQDYPGRVKFWRVGIPPSGPMDDFSFRVGNALVGNDQNEAGLEMTLNGPKLKFMRPCIVALTGAKMHACLNGQEVVPWWESFVVDSGDILEIGNIIEHGCRAYLAIRGGIQVPLYLGSRSTFPSGNLGGMQGRCLISGDHLPVIAQDLSTYTHRKLEAEEIPNFGDYWEIGVLPGPQESPDYFTEEAMHTFYNTDYVVHYNSNRLGVRLIGPKPIWARKDGGDGGSHPSNVHDHEYAIGTINFTGDMPIVLTVDGPSLGGFACPATIIASEFWKIGQVKANDKIRFKKTTIENALESRLKIDDLLHKIVHGKRLPNYKLDVDENVVTNTILRVIPSSTSHPGALIRLAGDRYILMEYGPMELDLNLRFRVHLLEQKLIEADISGLLETAPGVRSLQIQYDLRVLKLSKLLNTIEEIDKSLPMVENLKINTRIVRLPLAFDCKWTKEAISKYMKSIRKDAPYLPSNLDFIARNNGLSSASEVKEILATASYMVLGLGDVYLGAPCAVPVDPRHRLVVPKYNPARTYTPEGVVGIGGSYLCIYPMNSPGGYQLVGRTLPIWNTFTRTSNFSKGHPWMLRMFDQIQFHLVSEEELVQLRQKFSRGDLVLDIKETTFSVEDYNVLLKSTKEDVEKFKLQQQLAQKLLIEADKTSTEVVNSEPVQSDISNNLEFLNPSQVPIFSEFAGSVWNIRVVEGQRICKGDVILELEAMKMEFPVRSPINGVISKICVDVSQLAKQGTLLAVIDA